MASNNDTLNSTVAALEAGAKLQAAGAEARIIAATNAEGPSKPYALVPDGMKIQDLSDLLLLPQQIRATAKFPDQASFVAYTNRFKTDSTLLFADQDTYFVKAELDYHSPEKPQARCHTALLQLKKSKEWERWINLDQKPIGQSALWEFLYTNRRDILAPDAATVMEAIRNLKLTQNVVYEKAEDTRTGEVQAKYQKSVEDRTKGEYVLPKSFTVGLRPFTCNVAVPVELELRFRLNDDKLTFYLCFDRPDLILEEAFQTALKEVGDAVGIVPLIGQSTAG